MKTTRTLALFAGAFFLLATVANAQEKDLLRPAYSSIMLGAYTPENTNLNSEFAFFLVQGFMFNPYVGCQAELGGFSASDDNDRVTKAEGLGISVKLALPFGFIEPHLLAGADLDWNQWGFPVHAAFGVNVNFGTLQIGVEARQVWYEADGVNLDGLMVLEKISFRY